MTRRLPNALKTFCACCAFALSSAAWAQSSAPANSPIQNFYETECKRAVLYNENMDWGLPAATQTSDAAFDWKPTPLSIQNIRRVNACDLEKMIASPSKPLIVFTQPLFPNLIDGPSVKLPPGSIWVPNAGLPNASAEILTFMGQRILQIAGDPNRAIVVMSRGPMNWESVNLAINLKKMGFPNVLWFRGGQDSWLNAIPARKSVDYSPKDAYRQFMDLSAIQGAKQ